MTVGPPLLKASRSLCLSSSGVSARRPRGAETLGEADEIRARQVGGDRPVVVILDLEPFDVAVGVIVEDDRGERNRMVDGGRQFGDPEQRAAVAGNRDDRHVRAGMGRAERRRDAPAQRALIARRQVGPRLVAREGQARDIADLGQLVGEDAVPRQFRPDRRQPGHLGAEPVGIGPGDPGLLPGNRRAPVVAFRLPAFERRDEQRQRRADIAADTDIGFADAVEFVAVDIDMDDLHFVVDAPHHLLVEPRPDAENDIAGAPERVADRGADAQFAIARDDAAAGSVGDGRAGQNLRQPRHVFAAILGAAANDDDRPFRRFEQARSGLDCSRRRSPARPPALQPGWPVRRPPAISTR